MNKKIIGISGIIFFLALGWVIFYQFKTTKKIGYVTTLKLFDEFKGKKDIEKKFQQIQILKQSYLDSLKLKIQTVQDQGHQNEDKLNELKKVYLLRERQFSEENETLHKEYTEQIWKQINQFIEDYGKEKKYDYLLGATGQGNIMYASESGDITKEILEYINEKYEGKDNH